VAIVGGPNVSPEFDTFLQKAFDAVQTSWFGSYTVRARYQPIGVLRDASEKELILCNMSMRKSVFLAFRGFDTRLYPNEENELMNRIKAGGYRLLYQPAAIVQRSRRDSLLAFLKQNYTYGRGRMEQMLVGFFPSDLVHLIPGVCSLPRGPAMGAPRLVRLAFGRVFRVVCGIRRGGRLAGTPPGLSGGASLFIFYSPCRLRRGIMGWIDPCAPRREASTGTGTFSEVGETLR